MSENTSLNLLSSLYIYIKNKIPSTSDRIKWREEGVSGIDF
jgi:hypothetical protein